MPQQVWEGDQLAAKRSTGVTLEVIIREFVTHTPLLSVNKAAHFAFETQKKCY